MNKTLKTITDPTITTYMYPRFSCPCPASLRECETIPFDIIDPFKLCPFIVAELNPKCPKYERVPRVAIFCYRKWIDSRVHLPRPRATSVSSRFRKYCAIISMNYLGFNFTEQSQRHELHFRLISGIRKITSTIGNVYKILNRGESITFCIYIITVFL